MCQSSSFTLAKGYSSSAFRHLEVFLGTENTVVATYMGILSTLIAFIGDSYLQVQRLVCEYRYEQYEQNKQYMLSTPYSTYIDFYPFTIYEIPKSNNFKTRENSNIHPRYIKTPACPTENFVVLLP